MISLAEISEHLLPGTVPARRISGKPGAAEGPRRALATAAMYTSPRFTPLNTDGSKDA